MTDAQIAALRTAILAESDATFVALRDAGSTGEMAVWFNQPSAFVVWRTRVGVSDVMSNGFAWSEVDALTVGKARIWDWMSRIGFVNPSKSNVRQGLRDCFGSTSATYTGMLPHLKRPATRGERLFATGTGTDAAPGLLDFEGTVTDADVVAAVNLPG